MPTGSANMSALLSLDSVVVVVVAVESLSTAAAAALGATSPVASTAKLPPTVAVMCVVCCRRLSAFAFALRMFVFAIKIGCVAAAVVSGDVDRSVDVCAKRISFDFGTNRLLFHSQMRVM